MYFFSKARTSTDGTTRLIKITPQFHSQFMFCIVLPFKLLLLICFLALLFILKLHTSALFIRINILHAHYVKIVTEKDCHAVFWIWVAKTLDYKSELCVKVDPLLPWPESEGSLGGWTKKTFSDTVSAQLHRKCRGTHFKQTIQF